MDKDQKLLTAEQQELFHAANAKMLQPKVNWRTRCSIDFSIAFTRRYCRLFSAVKKFVTEIQSCIVTVLMSFLKNVYQEKHRMRGRNKISAKLRRKQKNVIDAQSLKMKEQLKEQREDREKAKKASQEASQPTAKSRETELVALKRFLKKQN